MLTEQGFHVGCVVMRKADKVRGEILSMAGSTVVIEVHEGPLTGTAQISADGFRRGQWKISKEKIAPLEVAGDRHSALGKSKELRLKVVQGKVAAAILAAEEKSKSCLAGLKVTLKPSRDVMAVKEFAKGELILNPATPKIVASDNPTSGMVSLGKIDGFLIHLVPHFQGPDKEGSYEEAFLPPFWAVRTTHDVSKTNMEMHHVYDPSKTNNVAKLTVMRNCRDIAANEVLFRWVPKKESTEVLEELTPVPPTKRKVTTKGH